MEFEDHPRHGIIPCDRQWVAKSREGFTSQQSGYVTEERMIWSPARIQQRGHDQRSAEANGPEKRAPLTPHQQIYEQHAGEQLTQYCVSQKRATHQISMPGKEHH